MQPFRFVLRVSITGLSIVPGTTNGERAEMAGRGPCLRCTGHALQTGPAVRNSTMPDTPEPRLRTTLEA